MNPEAILADSAVELAPDDYAVVATERPVSGAFATVDDGREVTQVLREERLDEVETLAAEPGWALLTFDATLPFELVGFLARVASTLAEEDIPVFALSAYSTDHVLVRRADAESALAALSDLGCAVRRP
ncbi:ACT domain-containing protein [Halogeometricum luteum]|uniref:ACT domain-containing protein n=1 Tax=Halogeometricum luteum TaxID=2950537 RepID=A0ABU2G229_9EURY|nr:ACT domain-containing protein [Halogeometricum sp. S3BR5-2]MDS0294546.1 ACT domain-containing protein [Halogeometricum sp. S3BR5-2]